MNIDEDSFKDKIRKYSKSLGEKLLYNLFILFHLLKSKDTPKDVKLIIVSALGYFILPLDVVPDFLPGGFIDDGLIIITAIKKVQNSITDEIRKSANEGTSKIIGKK
ncbi:MAG: DUF1232 domain-containing protein [Oligoflexia bacterium]|nr:DUF1232 domain-containing protein [Oligoflexia bacterium]